MSVPRARALDLMKAQCQVFATTYNPQGIRMGNKVLRQRLRGPALAAYYPRKAVTIKDVKRIFGPHLTTWDDAEEDRFEYIEEYELRPGPNPLATQRGKGNPKKKSGPPAAKAAPGGKKK
ncbi:Mitochondrial ribosomal subunit S27 [Geosmithia morbida]|uniref:Small ribosomal subunit protein mS33 n=1 Tax=Geosmithia morbida TaxID=1094350 RepID=A0A9P5D7A1_9HYPO|nr:Mitochondrial ribosomal subunit S27 [Geosmithia morbida]KAF4126421.1 Mitochondrial ribosomal subunit S27 [Geosmithia morbida]